MLIFVYGTLMRDGCRAGVMTEQQFIGAARTAAAYRLYDCGSYPGLIKADDGLSIEGELWSVDAACLRRLDQIEAVDEGLYSRETVRLMSPHENETVQAYLYAQSVEGLRDCGVRWNRSVECTSTVRPAPAAPF